MEYQNLFEEINKLNDKYIDIWKDICEIESPTTHKEGVDKCSRYVADWAKGLGFKAEWLRHDVAGDALCITMNPDSDAKPVCVSGHVDTVHQLGSFKSPIVKIADDKIYGPGVTDCKGGVVAGMYAMEALKSIGFTGRPVKLIVQSDEEMGSRPSSKETISFMCSKSEGAVAFINMEGQEAGKAVIERKGILTIAFTVKGKKAHASLCAIRGANAIAEAAYKIIEMEKLKDSDGLTCNCGVISGGTVANTVPDECVFKANIRFATQQQYDWAMDYAKKVSDEVHVPGCTCEITVDGMRPSMEKNSRNSELLDKINHIFKETGMNVLEPIFGTGGTDAAYITQFGIPCVDSLGVCGGKIHSGDEYAYIASLAESARRVAIIAYCI